jgi:N-acetylmuramoyl-L-alanine amidase
VSKFAVLILLGWFALLTGCTTAPPPPPKNWSATNPSIPATNRVPIPPVVHPVPPVVRTNLSPVAISPVPPTEVPSYEWTSLKHWAVERNISPPRLMTKSPLVTYAVSSAKGVMVLAIGSREVMWNGVTLQLGFAPEIVDGEVLVYGLDLQKNFAPFLCQPPPAFGPKRIIVIDPGHGGMNAGTVSVNDGRPEKEFTLDWALRMQPLLERKGWQVYLTRTNDVDIALSNRVAFAESHHADLFISLHFNSLAPDQKPTGLATFCLTPTGLPSTLTRGYPDLLTQSFPNNNFDTQNVQLAELLQRSLLQTSGLEDRGVSRARFIGVLRGQHRPAALIEAGFLSNPDEANRIESSEFRQTLAEAVAAALK